MSDTQTHERSPDTVEITPTANLPATSTPVQPPAEPKMLARNIRVGRHGIDFTNASDVMAFAKMMADSEYAVPSHCRNQPGVCLGIIDDAIRFGMSPFALARESYVVDSKTKGTSNLAYMAKAVAGIIIARAPIRGRPKYSYAGEGAKRVCTVTVVTNDGEVIKHPSPEFAKINPKNSPLWTSSPDQQHGYYTVREMARLHFPDVLMGLYDVDEMGVDSPITETRNAPLPPPTVAARLPGPSAITETVDVADIVHGTGDVSDVVIKPETIAGTVLSKDELAFLDGVEADLKPLKERAQVEVVLSQYDAQIETMRPEVRTAVDKIAAGMMAHLPKKAIKEPLLPLKEPKNGRKS